MKVVKEDNRLSLQAEDWADNAYLEHLLPKGSRPHASIRTVSGRYEDNLVIDVTKSTIGDNRRRDWEHSQKRSDGHGGRQNGDAGVRGWTGPAEGEPAGEVKTTPVKEPAEGAGRG